MVLLDIRATFKTIYIIPVQKQDWDDFCFYTYAINFVFMFSK